MVAMIALTFVLLCIGHYWIWDDVTKANVLWILFASYFWPITWIVAWTYGLGLLLVWAYGDIWNGAWR
jgi:hypothetical protein